MDQSQLPFQLTLLPGYFPGTRNLCLNYQSCHAFSSFLLRCFHLHAFKTPVNIISDAKTASCYIRYCILWQNANFYANNATVPRQVDFRIEGTCQLLVRFYLSKNGFKMSNYIMSAYATMWNDGIKCWERKQMK